jgi:Protein of unknown function (DUF3297)
MGDGAARAEGRRPKASREETDHAQQGRPAMADSPPDRLSNDPNSPYYDAALLERGVGIRFAGQEKTNVEEYCVSEGWIRVAAGSAKDRRGNPLTIKLKGPVEPYFRDAG